MSDENKTTADVLTIAMVCGLIGFLARSVRYARDYGTESPFNWARFLICTISAACVSVLMGWVLDGLSVNREITLAATGACGYVGGPLLDVAYEEILKTARAMFAALQSKLNR